MKKLLYTTTAFVLCGNIVQANAACIATPSCDALGYTSSTSCTNGIKCPFGNKWFCPKEEKCVDFPYVCAGQGYADGGGIGETCEGKYAKCTCEDGFEWIEGKGCIGKCIIGSILFSDKTCSMYMRAGKTPIGIVVYTNSTGGGQAIALNSIGNYEWGGYGTDIPTLTSFGIPEKACYDLNSCPNTAKIIAAGDKITYPAAWAAHEYKTEGTSAGDWCLPAAGIFNSYYTNKSIINTGFSRAGGIQFQNTTEAWSSSESSSNDAWSSLLDYNYGLDYYSKSSYNEVRPVIEF